MGKWPLPEGWEWKHLGDTLQMRSGNVDPRKHPDEVFELYSMPAYDAGPAPEILPGSEIGSSKKVVKPRDCLLSRLNPRIPRVWIVESEQGRRQISSTDFVALVDRKRPSEGNWFEPDFLRYVLLSPGFREQVIHGVQGATGSRQRLRNDDINASLLPIPPLDEQHRIVARIEALFAELVEARRLQEVAVQDTGELISATSAGIFAEAKSKGWPFKTVGDITRGKPQYGTSQKAVEEPMGVPILRMGNIIDGRVSFDDLKYIDLPPDEEAKYLLHEGDILFNRTNSAELVGKCAVYPSGRRAIFASYLIRVIADHREAIPEYIVAYINSPLGRQYIQAQLTRSIGQVNVNAKKLQAMPIPLPAIPEQHRIVAHLNDVQTQVAALRRTQEVTASELERLEQAILMQAFQGEL